VTESSAAATLTLDCLGLQCPFPVITLAKRIGEVEIGQVVTVLADDPAAAVDIPAWCRMTGQEYVTELPPYSVRRKR
jgi:tRNA 2-thiouridine synthesizing protein A